MKVQLFPATTNGYYRLESFSHEEVVKFVKQSACPACGEDDEPEVLALMGGNTMSEALKLTCCLSCGHITYDRLPTDAWFEHFYSKLFDQATQQWTFQTAQVASSPAPWGSIDHIRDLKLPLESKILDFGCGYGTGLLSLQKLGYENLFGVEMGKRRVEEANRYLQGRVSCGSVREAEELARDNGPFDLIVLHHVVEHLRDPFGTLSSLASLLAPRGILAVAVPEIYAESPIHLPLYFPHLHHFNTTSMMRLMRRIGLAPYRWTRSKPQLAIVGSRDTNWAPSAEAFSGSEVPITDAFRKGVAQFVDAPWRETQSADPIRLSYFHPWMAPAHPNGFQKLDPRTTQWINLGRYALFPQLFLDRRLGPSGGRSVVRALFRLVRLISRSVYQAFFKVARIVIPKETIINSEVIGFVPLGHMGAQVPWLTMPNGDVPVLVK